MNGGTGVWVAFLRAINVGAHNRIAMAELRRTFSDAGAAGVTTFLQTGNVLFQSGEAAAVAARVEASLQSRQVATRILLRSRDELARTLAGNPFRDATDPATVFVVFLAGEPDPAALSRLPLAAGDEAAVAFRGREAFIRADAGYSRTRLTATWLEHHLGLAATARNLRVARDVLARAAKAEGARAEG